MTKHFKTDLMDHLGLVYVIGSSPDGPVKIGYSARLRERARGLNVGSPYRVKVFGVRFAMERPLTGRMETRDLFKNGARRLEAAVHCRLRGMDLNMNGEWFNMSAADALAAIDKVGKVVGPRAISLTDLLAVDLDGRSDKAMAKMHMRLMHEALAINQFIQWFNEGLTYLENQPTNNATANSV